MSREKPRDRYQIFLNSISDYRTERNILHEAIRNVLQQGELPQSARKILLSALEPIGFADANAEQAEEIRIYLKQNNHRLEMNRVRMRIKRGQGLDSPTSSHTSPSPISDEQVADWLAPMTEEEEAAYKDWKAKYG
jgi:hypothetical protein